MNTFQQVSYGTEFLFAPSSCRASYFLSSPQSSTHEPPLCALTGFTTLRQGGPCQPRLVALFPSHRPGMADPTAPTYHLLPPSGMVCLQGVWRGREASSSAHRGLCSGGGGGGESLLCPPPHLQSLTPAIVQPHICVIVSNYLQVCFKHSDLL